MNNDFIVPRGHVHSRGRIRSTPRGPLTMRDVNYTRRPIPNPYNGVINRRTTIVMAPVSITIDQPRVREKLETKVNVELDIEYNDKAHTVSSAVVVEPPLTHQKKSLRAFRKNNITRALIIGLAIIVLAVTGYVGFDTWQTNNRVKTQLGQSGGVGTNGESSTPEARQAAEGSDKTPLVTNALKNYAVAPDLPRALYIEKAHVAARILPMNVNPDSSVQAPINIFDSGWYTGSVKPGEVGAMFIDGHSSGATHEGLFGNLDKLVVGDTLQVEKGDGTRLTYKVVHTAVVDKDNVDMRQMLLPYGNALRALNLITCTGTWVDNSQTLSQRFEVFTEQI
ncbi:MAG: class F sortase [Candidatus Saccharimonadales bacterium]